MGNLPSNRCNFVPYGEVENRCTKCGYITWVDTTKTYDEIVSDMIKCGYDKPDCDIYDNSEIKNINNG